MFLLHDKLVLFRGALGLESLPRKAALEEINENVAYGLEVVTAGLFDPQVVVDGGITGSTSKGSSLALRDVLKGTRMAVAFRQSEIDAVDKITRSAAVGDEVGRLDVAMDEMAAVHDLNSFQHLISNHENGFETKSPSTFVELILKGGPK